ncbi:MULTISPECIES: AMP-binding protein [Thermomonospora]|uniref:Long-chain acyl-CoA synthetase n=1 Tax=Thermomonospora cellulosilytica TaxID=1411118 RepID=A0A7W3MZ61_9ACTN|nr:MULTISPECIES: AMP-binding protein [Thermomonospora]MBA9004571.1 long-chain acyl-CoA synthetase [Thermomonospora cellulosilytica]
MPADIDVPDIPVTRLLDDAAARRPRNTAFWFFGRRLTYRQVLRSADRFAAGLRSLGVGPGDRVALLLPNCPQQVIAFFGALRLGAIVAQHNPLYTEEEMRHQLADCGARVVVVLDRSYPTLRAVRRTVRLEHVVVTSIVDYLPWYRRLALRLPLASARRERARVTAEVPPDTGVVRFAELLRRPARRVRQAEVDPARHLAVIQYTGGTEGRPKGVMLTHRNLIANACQQHAWDVGCRYGAEVTLAVLPLFHSFGLMSCLISPVMKAGAVVLLPRFNVARTVRVLRRHRPTIFPGVPTLYQELMGTPGVTRRDLASVRIFLSGASGIDERTIARFREWGLRGLIQAYGLTEASPAVSANPLDGSARNRTVGLPLPGTEVLVVDSEDPTVVLPPGRPGELVVRGPQVFAGYWNRPEETARVLSPNGWLRTGDIGVMDPDGWLTIIDRKRDLVKVNGFSVYPSEVEEVLRRHPAVLDCAVLGLPDERRGERVVACVVEHPAYPFSAEELRRHCEKYLSHYKVPARFVPFTELPRSPVGKVRRRVLREEYLRGGLPCG